MLQVTGCTKLPAAGERCLDLDPQGDIGDGLATLRVLLALRSGLSAPPPAAVTARLWVNPDSNALSPKLQVVSRDVRTNGVTVNTGGTVDTTRVDSFSLPGSPGELAVVTSDAKLIALSTVAPGAGSLSPNERMFVSTFGMTRQTYRDQPGLRRCGVTGVPACTAANINTFLAESPGRITWAEGNVTLNADIGTTAAPVLLVINGNTLTLGASVDIVGFVYLTGGNAGGAVTINLPDSNVGINGALVSETSLTTSSAGTASRLTVTYDPGVLNKLRTGYGSWVRVPGSWKELQGMNMQRSSTRWTRGVSLMEALVAVAAMGIGMFGIVGLQATYGRNSDIAKQRSEAVRFAQEAIEEWRAITAMDVTANRLAYAQLVSTGAEEEITGVNATFRRTRTITPMDAGEAVPERDTNPRAKSLQVTVTWVDRAGDSQSVSLSTAIAGIMPELAATLAVPADGDPVRKPFDRHRGIPVQAKLIDEDHSAIKPPGASTGIAWRFDNETALITLCTTTAANTAAITTGNLNCSGSKAMLLSGSVRYATQLAQPTNVASPPADPLVIEIWVDPRSHRHCAIRAMSRT